LALDVTSAKLICAALSLGADFARTVTLGRQSFGLTESTLNNLTSRLHLASSAKQLAKEKFSEPFFRAIGAETVDSVDISNYEGASVLHDMNLPIPANLEGRYSVLFDGGCLQHIFNLSQALKNTMKMLELGGHFLQVAVANNFMGFGFWQLSPEVLYRVFSPENGFKMLAVLVREVDENWHEHGPWYLARDPAQVGWACELVNKRRTVIATIAQRVEVRPIFGSPPQQSLFERAWQDSEASAAQLRPRRLIELARRFIPHSVEHAVRSPYNPKCFVRLREDDLLCGRFPELA
jgi:hypothetical protein